MEQSKFDVITLTSEEKTIVKKLVDQFYQAVSGLSPNDVFKNPLSFAAANVIAVDMVTNACAMIEERRQSGADPSDEARIFGSMLGVVIFAGIWFSQLGDASIEESGSQTVH